jgi:hypothetical protein
MTNLSDTQLDCLSDCIGFLIQLARTHRQQKAANITQEQKKSPTDDSLAAESAGDAEANGDVCSPANDDTRTDILKQAPHNCPKSPELDFQASISKVRQSHRSRKTQTDISGG